MEAFYFWGTFFFKLAVLGIIAGLIIAVATTVAGVYAQVKLGVESDKKMWEKR